MGLPWFFAYLLRNHKNIISNPKKDVDILYLDANCLIHPQCQKILEENIDVTDT